VGGITLFWQHDQLAHEPWHSAAFQQRHQGAPLLAPCTGTTVQQCKRSPDAGLWCGQTRLSFAKGCLHQVSIM
jgi:hypothetical protein